MRIPATNSCAGVLIFFLLFCGLASTTQAAISYTSSQIFIVDMPDCDIQDVYDALLPSYGDLLLYPDPVDPTIWYLDGAWSDVASTPANVTMADKAVLRSLITTLNKTLGIDFKGTVELTEV